MDESTSNRLSGLSKKQLLAAIEALTGECGSTAINALTGYLDTIQFPRGSSNVVKKSLYATEVNTEPTIAKMENSFTLEKYRTRQIALQIQYDGTAYLGFASQDLEETIENHLFNALVKLKLIEDRKTCQYSRCGRTDKGVSALGQVISVNVRSAIPKDLPEHLMDSLKHPGDKIVIENPAALAAAAAAAANKSAELDATTEDSAAVTSDNNKGSKKSKNKNATAAPPSHKTVTEMDYVTMLNRSLPDDIRVLGWCPVTPEFSARFSASHRGYRYFFLKGTLDIPAMERAAALLVGEHDFRNICKIDIGNVTNFRREIYSAQIKLFQRGSAPSTPSAPAAAAGDCIENGGADTSTSTSGEGSDDIYMLEIRGIAFLWHMVRCIMAVLFMVGQRLEDASIVTQLLDIQSCTGKPPYAMAAEQPLVLHECGFDNLHIQMQARHLWQLTAHYRDILEGHLISAARTRNSLQYILQSSVRKSDVADFVLSLQEREQMHSKKLAGKGVQNGPVSGSAEVAAAEGPLGGSKRKLADFLSAPATADSLAGARASASESNFGDNSVSTSTAVAAFADTAADDSTASMSSAQEEISWAAVLQHLEAEYNLVPKVKYIPHVPLMQRKKEDSYEQKVMNLAGNKKERLDRHVTLSSAAAESGATPSFFQKMRQQGSL